MMHNIVPLPSYPGRKGAAGAYQKIISQIPKCEVFVEAMCGSAIIASLVTGCRIVINDCDRSVIDKINCTGEVEVYNYDYKQIIQNFDHGKNTVFFFDPPYLFSTRSYQGDIYKYEWEKLNHITFLQLVKRMKSHVIISHYPCDLYNETLKDWRVVSYNSMTRAGVRTENLYMNFPPPVLLQSYQYIGENFTDRQRIKRKVNRMVEKLKRETDLERAAILSSIIDHFSYAISK